jgi:integrase
MFAYEAALKGIAEPAPSRQAPPGSVHSLAIRYYASADFRALRESTQATYRGIIEGIRERCGDLPARKIERKHIAAMIAKRADTPAAANNELRIWRLLMRCAVEADIVKIDPTNGVRKVRHATEGFRTWTEDDIAKFEAAFPIGTRERLALGLLLYTAARRSDTVQFGPQHVRNNRLNFRQTKTGGEVDIPVHPELADIIAGTACGHLTFLVTAQGKPFTPAGFTNWFHDAVRKAGLPDGCAPHGLRKAASRRLAEASATGHQIMSVTGHRSLKEVNRYTEAANRAQLADAAIGALVRPQKAKTRTRSVKPARKV